MWAALISCVAAWIFVGVASAAQIADWPGVWMEAEAGKGDAHPSSIQYASGHSAIDLQSQGGDWTIDANLPEPIPGAILYLRYARDGKDSAPGNLDVYVGPAQAVTIKDSGVRLIGHLALPSTGRLSEWRWVRLTAGDIDAGPHRLYFSPAGDQAAGYLDLIGLVPGSTGGLWQPPNDVFMGSFRDDPRVLPAFDVISVDNPTFGNLLPVGKNVTFAVNVRNNGLPADLDLTVHGQLRGDDGKTIDLPAQTSKIAADSTHRIDYSFALPGPGHFEMTLTAEANGSSVPTTRWLTAVPVDPIWITPHGRGTEPLHVSGAGALGTIDLDVPTSMSAGLIYVSYQHRDRDESQGSEPLDIYLGSADATGPTSLGVRRLGEITLDPLTRFGQQERWAAVNAGELPAGKYRLFLSLPAHDAPPDDSRRSAINLIRQIGVIPDVDQGRWLPPIESLDAKGVVTVDEAQLLKEAVHIESVSCDETGQLFLGSKVLEPKPSDLPFHVTVASRIVTQAVDCVIRGRLLDGSKSAADIAPLSIHLEPGERRDIAYPIRAPGYGWYSLEVETEALNLHDTGHSALGILRDPHDGVRPDSLFGLAVGDRPEDMKVSQLIGVKWRRGIPFTNPADVFIKTGDPLVMAPGDKITVWGPDEIKKARDVIDDWKQAGVMCLGYINYNLPWNCLGGAAGGWHKNRPADMKLQVDMVYNLIKPLHDEVKYWEIWNEPWVGGWTWRTGTAQDYRDMCRMIWEKVKPEMPDVMLIGGGSTPYDRDVVFAENSDNAGYVDGVSSHPYGKPDTNHPSFAAIEAAMLKKFAQGGGKGGIWATELGTAAYMFDPLPRTEADLMVARTVAPLYLLAKLGAGDTAIRLFFFASQYGSGQFSGGEHNLWDATGGSPAPRPALVAYSAMTHFIEDARLIGDIYSTSKAAWALHFVKPDGSSVVVFLQEQGAAGDVDPIHASDSERATGEMLLPAHDFEVFDYLGRQIDTRQGDDLHIPIQVWEARYIVSKMPVEQVHQALLDAQFAGIPALMVNARSFDAPLPAKPKLRFKIENLLPQTVDAKLEITAPAELTLASTSAELKQLKPGEIRWAEFDVTSATPNDANRYLIKYHATAAGIVQDEQQVVQVACATYGTPKIDGDLSSDWNDTIPVTMLSRGGKDWRQIAMDPSQAAALMAQKQPSDTVVYRMWTKWDDQNFYAAAVVPCSKPDAALPYNGPISSDKNMPFMHDCLQLAFASLVPNNPDDLVKGNPLYEKAMADDVDYEFCAALIANGKSELHRLKAPGTNLQTYYPTNGPTVPPLGAINTGTQDGPKGQVVVRYDAKAQTYVYEVAIPWANIKELGEQLHNLKPGQRLSTHFAFAVNDRNGPGRTFWTQEAGDLESGSYGFDPTWGGGCRKLGGRIITDWGFVR
jgi:hypothetical protein